MSYLAAFARFWWDFIVGDSIALAIGAILALGGAAALAHAGFETAAELLLPAGVVATLLAALQR